MLFTSFIFLQIFLPVVNLVSVCLRNIKWKNIFLLAASLFFYAWGEPKNVFLLIFSLFVNYFIARYGLAFDLNEKIRKRFLIAGLLFNTIILFMFKYSTPIILFFGRPVQIQLQDHQYCFAAGNFFFYFPDHQLSDRYLP